MEKNLSEILLDLRMKKGSKLKEVAATCGIDQALQSKFETGSRLPTKEQLQAIANYYDYDFSELNKLLLAEKIYRLLEEEEDAHDALLAAEPRIEFLSKRAKEKIKIDQDLVDQLTQLDLLRQQWKKKKKVVGIHKEKMDEYFSVQYTFESNKIEGNTLTLNETMMIVKEGITISGKSVNEHLEAINHSEAIALLYDMVNNKSPLNEYNILQIHGLILRGIDKNNAGKYRSVNVRITGSEHIPPEPYLISKLMEDYFLFYNSNKAKLHPVILAAEMHERLVSIHPFIDGNGRTSRLIMNLILVSFGYPIAILKGDFDSRMKYYKALEKVQIDNSPTPFYALIIEALSYSLQEHIKLS